MRLAADAMREQLEEIRRSSLPANRLQSGVASQEGLTRMHKQIMSERHHPSSRLVRNIRQNENVIAGK